MKKIAIVVVTMLCAALVFSKPSWADIRFGVAAESYPPFTAKDASGKWVGWEMDLMQALCGKLAEKCSVVDVAWEGIIPALQAHKFDVILASMAVTEKRRAVIEFSDVYYKSTPQLLSEKTQPAYHTPVDLVGKRVGVQNSSIHAMYAEKYFSPIGAKVKVYSKQDEVFADLAAGRLDYAMADALALDAFLQSESGACCVLSGAVTFDPEVFGPGVGLGLRKEDADLRQRLNGALKALSAEGEVAHITQVWHLTGKIIIADQ